MKPVTSTSPSLDTTSNWVEKTFSSLNQEERIAQLIQVAAYSNRDDAHRQEISALVYRYGIGGLTFFQDDAVKQVELTNYYQDKAKVPLMISIDGEWGLAMRLKNTPFFPYQMLLGALSKDKLIYQMGAEIGRQCKRMGIHVNFAPAVDINNNPNNPVINFRAFGEDKHKVAQKGISYMWGLQDQGVMACAKHFPGHGDTDVDSHLDLPVIPHKLERLEEVELSPFQELISHGVGSVMVSHLHVPALDSRPNLPATFSHHIITKLLKEDWGYEGLIFTDALDMKAVANMYPPEIVATKAILAGNDILLNCENVPKAIEEIKRAIQLGQISQEEIDKRCKKVLAAKLWLGLDKYQPVETEGLEEELNSPKVHTLNYEIAKDAITLISNKREVVPLSSHPQKLACLAIGEEGITDFQTILSRETEVDHYHFSEQQNLIQPDSLMSQLGHYDKVLICVHADKMKSTEAYGMHPSYYKLLEKLPSLSSVILIIFGNAYILSKIKHATKCNGIMMAYQNSMYTQRAAVDVLTGKVLAAGSLPVNLGKGFPVGFRC
ncbi:MAG: glycoside hydrolase family 3 N-terminal domain-containing protein [Bacteroidota bacterium]